MRRATVYPLLAIAVVLIGIVALLANRGEVAPPANTGHSSATPRDEHRVDSSASAKVRDEAHGDAVMPARVEVANGAICTVVGTLRTRDITVIEELEVAVVLLVDGAPSEAARQSVAASGEFSIVVPWHENSAMQVLIRGTGVAHRGRVLPSIERDEVRRLGELDVYAGAILSGSVRDLVGHPVGGLRMTLDAVEPVEVDALGAVQVNRAFLEVGVDGVIATGAAIRHGRWRVRLAGSGLRSVTPSEFDIDGLRAQVELVVRTAPTIEGVVLDGDGRGVPGVQLEALTIEGAQRVSMLPCVSDERGAFQLRAVDAADGDAAVLVQLIEGVDRQRYRIGKAEPVAWGSSGYTVLVGDAPSFDLQVLDSVSGRAIEDYAISCEPDGTLVWRGAGSHPGGRTRLEPAGAGPWFLSVLPADEQWPIVLGRQLTQEDALAPLVLTIERRPRLVVSVRSGGEPVRGARSSCIALAGEAVPFAPDEARAIDAIGNLLAYHGTGPARLAMASTGYDGTATMRALPQFPGMVWLCVEAPGHAMLLRPLNAAGDARIDVTMQRDAKVSGSVRGEGASSVRPRLVACPVLGDTVTPGPIAAAAQWAGDDTFSLSLAPGAYGLWAFTDDAWQLVTTFTLTAAEQRPLGPLQLPPR
ncbi:MAG: hypothetical protein H6835_17750 [Planctomycetes bacterium]|nr:hypothetical protein [Planctomycetota bacterium]